MLIRNYIVPVLTIANSQKSVQETFLCSSESPDGKFNLEAYRTEPGATVDYSVRVYMINGNQKEIIYNAYHESEAKIDWLIIQPFQSTEKRLICQVAKHMIGVRNNFLIITK